MADTLTEEKLTSTYALPIKGLLTMAPWYQSTNALKEITNPVTAAERAATSGTMLHA